MSGGSRRIHATRVPETQTVVIPLIRVHHQAAATGAQLRVVMANASVRRVVELTGADQLLLVYPSLSGAQANGSGSEPVLGTVAQLSMPKR